MRAVVAVLDAIYPYSPSVLAVSAFFFAVGFGRWFWRRVYRGREADFPFAAFGGTIAIGALMAGIVTAVGFQARAELAAYLYELPCAEVHLSGDVPAETCAVIEALRHARKQVQHHSFVVRRIPITVESSRGRLNVVLGRDSQWPNEYWVFYPKYGASENIEVARAYLP